MKINSLIITCIIFIATFLRAEHGFEKNYKDHVNIIKNFMKKKDNCYLSFIQISNQNLERPEDWSIYPKKVFCILDMVFHKGTIKEREGCYISLYNPSKNKYYPLYRRRSRGELPISQKKCAAGGFEELKTKKFRMLHSWEPQTIFEHTLEGHMNKYSCYQEFIPLSYKSRNAYDYFKQKNSEINKKTKMKCDEKKNKRLLIKLKQANKLNTKKIKNK